MGSDTTHITLWLLVVMGCGGEESTDSTRGRADHSIWYRLIPLTVIHTIHTHGKQRRRWHLAGIHPSSCSSPPHLPPPASTTTMAAAVTPEQIEAKLKEALGATHVQAMDLSDGCGAKFEVLAVSGVFEGRSVSQPRAACRHRRTHRYYYRCHPANPPIRTNRQGPAGASSGSERGAGGGAQGHPRHHSQVPHAGAVGGEAEDAGMRKRQRLGSKGEARSVDCTIL
jgi:hypothetical protein